MKQKRLRAEPLQKAISRQKKDLKATKLFCILDAPILFLCTVF